MEQQNELQIGIGNEEAVILKPTTVKIVDVKIEELGEKKAKKVVCSCQHPDSPTPIHISEAKYEKKGKLELSGLWVNKDSKGLLKKGSALATFLNSLGCANIEALKGKDVITMLGDKGYLCFKAY